MRLSACHMCSAETRVHQKGQFVPLVGDTDSIASDVTQLRRCSAVTRPISLVCLFHSTQQILLFFYFSVCVSNVILTSISTSYDCVGIYCEPVLCLSGGMGKDQWVSPVRTGKKTVVTL